MTKYRTPVNSLDIILALEAGKLEFSREANIWMLVPAYWKDHHDTFLSLIKGAGLRIIVEE